MATRLLLLILLIASLIGTLGYWSIALHDTHYMNRFGSLVVCVSLCVAAVQFLFERRSERRLESADTVDPLDRLVQAAFGNTPKRLKQRWRRTYDNNRGWLFVYSVCFGIVGELLHGWGDILLLHYGS